jgi:hypothetical protein
MHNGRYLPNSLVDEAEDERDISVRLPKRSSKGRTSTLCGALWLKPHDRPPGSRER